MATKRWCPIFPKWDSYQPLWIVRSVRSNNQPGVLWYSIWHFCEIWLAISGPSWGTMSYRSWKYNQAIAACLWRLFFPVPKTLRIQKILGICVWSKITVMSILDKHTKFAVENWGYLKSRSRWVLKTVPCLATWQYDPSRPRVSSWSVAPKASHAEKRSRSQRLNLDL
jgi:hypothetical protein